MPHNDRSPDELTHGDIITIRNMDKSQDVPPAPEGGADEIILDVPITRRWTAATSRQERSRLT